MILEFCIHFGKYLCDIFKSTRYEVTILCIREITSLGESEQDLTSHCCVRNCPGLISFWCRVALHVWLLYCDLLKYLLCPQNNCRMSEYWGLQLFENVCVWSLRICVFLCSFVYIGNLWTKFLFVVVKVVLHRGLGFASWRKWKRFFCGVRIVPLSKSSYEMKLFACNNLFSSTDIFSP